MKTRITAGLLACALLLMAVAAVASAASTTTSKGKLTSFTYNASTKVGHLKTTGKRKLTFKLPANTNCGVSRGQSGDQIPCKTLGSAKYRNKVVRVTWKLVSGTRVASLVVVDLT